MVGALGVASGRSRSVSVRDQAAGSLPRWTGTRRSSSSNTATSSRRAPSASRYCRSVDTRTSSECSSLEIGALGHLESTCEFGLADCFAVTKFVETDLFERLDPQRARAARPRRGGRHHLVRSSENLVRVHHDQSFFFDLSQVFVVQVISRGDRPLVPVVPRTGLVTTEQQDRLATRIEREQHP